MKNFLILLCSLPVFGFSQLVTSKKLVVVKPVIATESVVFAFTLQEQSTTSAGVFAPDRTLLKTLWSNVSYSAGVNRSWWDGKDQDGKVYTGEYVIKVLSNNVKYEWEGVIGNSSTAKTGKSIIRHPFGYIQDLVVEGDYAYYAGNYREGGVSNFKFAINNPYEKLDINPTFQEALRGPQTEIVATDGINVYWGGADPFGQKYKYTYNGGSPATGNCNTFVWATKISDGADVVFTGGGEPYTMALGRPIKTILSMDMKPAPANGIINNYTGFNHVTGLAVQRTGNLLFVAREQLNKIQVYNKTTGALVNTLTYDKPKYLKIGADGKLWMVTNGTQVSSSTINSNGTLNTLFTKDLAFSPIAFAVTTDNTNFVATDSATSQLKWYNTATGEPLLPFGQAGGYKTNSTVFNDKFDFRNPMQPDEPGYTFISFAPDGSFWMADQGNLRTMHFSANRTYIEHIMNIGRLYACAVDVNNPTRAFANYLEFQVDYSKPLEARNGSWKLVKNWVGGVIPANDTKYYRLSDVTTLSNGRTYSTAYDAVSGYGTIIELVDNGTVRYTGVKVGTKGNSGLSAKLNSDGSISQITGTATGMVTTWQKRPLTGFDVNNNPTYANLINIGSSGVLTLKDPVSGGNGSLMANPVTYNNVIVSFDPSKYNGAKTRGDGYHAGGIRVGSNKWLWKTSPSTRPGYMGPYPNDGTYDLGNGVGYAGAFAGVVDSNLFWGYKGEFWKGSQTNKWQHYKDDGLLIGVFGVTGKDSTEPAPYGMAGNLFGGRFVRVGNYIYLYHNDEGVHGGIHRWKISGLETVKEQVAQVIYEDKPTREGVDLMAGLPYFEPMPDTLNGWSRTPIADSSIVRSRYLTYKESESEVRVFLQTKAAKGFTSQTVNRSLPVVFALTNWKLSGELAYMSDSNSDTSYFEVLDNNNRVIARFNRSYYFFFNNVKIIDGNYAQVAKKIGEFQPFEISGSSSGIAVKYSDFAVGLFPLIDPLANPLFPVKIRVYLASKASQKMDVILKDLWFTSTAPVLNFKTDFGAKGDGTDDYAAFQSLATYANTNKTVNVFFPAGDYYISKYHDSTNAATVKDVVFKDCSSIKITGEPGTRISLNGSFYRSIDRATPSGNTLQSYQNSVAPFIFDNCSNIDFKGLEIDGNVDNMTKEAEVTEGASCLLKFIRCSNVSVQDVYAHHGQTDGIIISGGFVGSGFITSKNFAFKNVKSHYNARQGMSVGGLENGLFTNCEFKYTGITGNYGFHAPAAGIDIEPDAVPRIVKNVTFMNCVFEENSGGQFIATRPSTTSNITLKKCTTGKTTTTSSSQQGLTFFVKNGLVDSCTFDMGGRNISVLSVTPLLTGSTVTIQNSYIKSALNGISTSASTDNSDSAIIRNNVFEFDGLTMGNNVFPSLLAKNVSFLNNRIIVNSSAIASRGITSIIRNAIISQGNCFVSENPNVKPVVSYTGTLTVDDVCPTQQ